MMKKLVLVGFILLFVFCAKKQTTVETEGLEEVIVFGEEEATISEEPVYPTVEEEPIMPPAEEEVYQPAETPPATPAQVFGFRIQIFASSTNNNANRVANDARAVFGNQSVYVDHVVPYYKVRVGDCLTREEAEALRRQALNLGFAGAFIVETMITP